VLSGQAIAISGVLLALLGWRAAQADGAGQRLWGLVAAGALVVAVAQMVGLALLAWSVDASSASMLARLAATQFVWAMLARVVAALVVVVVALARRREPRERRWSPLLLAGVATLVVSGVWTSHGMARLGDRGVVLALSALHQLAASVWIGGLAHLVVTAFHPQVSPAAATAILRRFSVLALRRPSTSSPSAPRRPRS
jgi:putative copper resistance protein D